MKVSSPKFKPRFIGPYRISEVLNPVSFRLTLPASFSIHNVFHRSLLRRYVAPVVPSVDPPAPVLVEGELEYIVEKILDSRISRRKLQYLVKWKGYGQEDNSWVFASDVHAADLVRAFHLAHPGRPGGSACYIGFSCLLEALGRRGSTSVPLVGCRRSEEKQSAEDRQLKAKVVNEELYRKTFEEIVRSLDKLENDCIPSATLSQREFSFKDVKYMQLQVQTFTIHNDGQVACQYEFISKLDERSYSKQWLRANPSKGFLTPGSKAQIELELFVNNQTAARLNSGEEKLEDILILHLDRGKDFFLSVSGDYLYSSFGSSIQMLCYMREPIRDMSANKIRELAHMPLQMKDDFVGAEKPLDVPKELCMMVDHLYRNASLQEDLFQQPGLRSEFEAIRDYLDTGFPESIRIL
ncbi:unnamed protein product [Ranitomeya imitator]|uniref:Chromo domain-containing protein n=1 Tax=Ranitomeya imitator TaxID=111125 RepID=A0ABN9LMH1_9NEOB|nr:unnamed protein product [Ranitomeya imitator]